MERTITICGKEVKLRASALAPRIYRFKFGRDIFKDFAILNKNYREVLNSQDSDEDKQIKQLSILDLTIFENLAWVFARQGDPENVPDSPDAWLDTFDGTFSIYEVLPQIIDLWNVSSTTQATPAKK